MQVLFHIQKFIKMKINFVFLLQNSLTGFPIQNGKTFQFEGKVLYDTEVSSKHPDVRIVIGQVIFKSQYTAFCRINCRNRG